MRDINKRVETDKRPVMEKLKEENSRFAKLEFLSREEYERDLKNLVLVLPSY